MTLDLTPRQRFFLERTTTEESLIVARFFAQDVAGNFYLVAMTE